MTPPDRTGPGAAAGTPVLLRDGRTVLVRQIVPADRGALRDMYAGVSAESRYRRFLSVHPELGAQELSYLTELDHSDHEAVAAFAPDGSMVGIVRYVRLHHGDADAEPAMLVHDDWQGAGLGAALLDRLVVRAWSQGIRRFRAPVLAENAAALRSLDRLGHATHHLVGAEIEVEIDLDEPAPEAERRSRRGRRPPLSFEGLLGSLRPARPAAPRRNLVVVGAGQGPGAPVTLEAASSLAVLLGAELLLVHAARDAGEPLPEPAAAEVERLRARGLTVGVETVRSTPAAAIVDACRAHGAAYAVLGATGRAHGLIGAIADVVTRQAPCNVLLVRSLPLPAP